MGGHTHIKHTSSQRLHKTDLCLWRYHLKILVFEILYTNVFVIKYTWIQVREKRGEWIMFSKTVSPKLNEIVLLLTKQPIFECMHKTYTQTNTHKCANLHIPAEGWKKWVAKDHNGEKVSFGLLTTEMCSTVVFFKESYPETSRWYICYMLLLFFFSFYHALLTSRRPLFFHVWIKITLNCHVQCLLFWDMVKTE